MGSLHEIKDLDTLGLDMQLLQRELDKIKTAAFQGNNAAFLGGLMCSMNFYWTTDIRTAATDGTSIMWHPVWFLRLEPMTRRTVLMHELWHTALMHFVRMGDRIPIIWNYATDIKINNDLTKEGYSFNGLSCWRDTRFMNMVEEDIYDALINMKTPIPPGGAWGVMPDPNEPPPSSFGDDMNNHAPIVDDGSDLLPMTQEQQRQAIDNVVRSAHQATINGGAGAVPGDVEKVMKQFLQPVVPWEKVLMNFFLDLIENGYTWNYPDRRYASTIYMPSEYEEDGRLEHLVFFQDKSGSISDKDSVRMNSEVKYCWDQFRPKKLTVVQFDTKITNTVVFEEGDEFDEIKVRGGGGTSLVPVRQWIIDNRPTAAIIFSDMECEPMEHPGFEIPIIWICISNRKATVPFGTLVHIR